MEEYLPPFIEIDDKYRKVGRESTTIKNPAFAAGIDITNKALESENIQYALYGGTALQLLLHYYIRDERTLTKILRPTSDYDIVVRERDLDKIYYRFKNKDLVVEGEDYIFEGKSKRYAKKRIIVEIYGVKNNQEYSTITTITFITDNKLGEKMIEEYINYESNVGGIRVKAKVAPPEYILVGKLKRMNPYRDVPDIYNALLFLPLDLNKMYKSFKGIVKDHHYSEVKEILNKIENKEELRRYLWKRFISVAS